MKLITLNSHSIIEPDYEEKLLGFCGVVRKEQPQIMALQEVNQTISAKPAPESCLEETGYLPCAGGQSCIPAGLAFEKGRISHELDLDSCQGRL